MVYKKYIKRNGKIYGPYYYESYRKNGKVVTKYVGSGDENRKIKNKNYSNIFLIISAASLVLFFVFLSANFLTGRVVEQHVNANSTIKIINQIEDVVIRRNYQYTLDLNDYFENVDSYTVFEPQNVNFNIRNSILTIVPEKDWIGTTTSKITAKKDNQSIESLFNIIVSENGLDVKTSQKKAVVGKQVKWNKKIILEEQDEVVIELPKESEEISVKKILEDEAKQVESEKVKVTGNIITGNVVAEIKKDKGVFSEIYSSLFRFFTRDTSFQISKVGGEVETLEVRIRDDATNYEIEYATPAPESVEQRISNNKKKIKIGSNIAYKDVVGRTFVQETDSGKISITGGVVSGFIDNNNDGLVDEVSWVSDIGEEIIIEEKIDSGVFTSEVDMYSTYDSVFHIDYEDLKIKLKPYYYSDKEKHYLDEISEDVTPHNHVYNRKINYKFAFGIFNFSKLNADKVGFEVESNQKSLVFEQGLIFEEIYIDFSDLSDYDLELYPNYVEVSGNFSDNLYLDPTVANLHMNITLSSPEDVRIDLDLLYPTSNINVSKYEMFNISVNITCRNTNCDYVNVSLDPLMQVYLPNMTGNSWYGNSSVMNLTMDSETEYSDAKKDVISNDNDTYVWVGCYDGMFAGHKLLYNIESPVNEINKIEIFTRAIYSGSGGDKSYLYAWNHTSNSWNLLDTIDITYLEFDLTANISDAQNFVNNSGDLYLLVRGDNCLELNGGQSDLYYSQIKVYTKGLVSNVIGDIPFYTNLTNPYNLALSQDESELIRWHVNATGDYRVYEFFAYANKTSQMNISNYTNRFNVTIVFSDFLPPVITLQSPIDGYSRTQGDINFVYQVRDDSNIDFCRLIIDGNTDQTDNSITKDVNQQFTKSFSSDGSYTWKIECRDEYGYESSSETRAFSISSSGCVPDCSGKECGGDGCGGSCGICGENYYCDGGFCVLQELAQAVLNVEIIIPGQDTDVTKNELFNVSVNVTCVKGYCGKIEVGLDPEKNEEIDKINKYRNLNIIDRVYNNFINSIKHIIK